MSVSMLEIRLQKSFDGFRLDVAFTVDDGLVVLFGPSGSGKSLTLQAIAGTVQPDAGRIVLVSATAQCKWPVRRPLAS